MALPILRFLVCSDNPVETSQVFNSQLKKQKKHYGGMVTLINKLLNGKHKE